MKNKSQYSQDNSYLKEPSGITRRHFLAWLGWSSAAFGGGGLVLGAGAYITPRLNLEPPTSYAVGWPENFKSGEMQLINDRRLFIFRTPLGFQAVSAVCTHLGCSYQPFGRLDNEYLEVHAHCPCHGSVFHRDGSVLKGPAPHPLPFYEMRLSLDGRLFVDESVTDESNWAGIDHRIYLTEDGKKILGPLPDGKELNFT